MKEPPVKDVVAAIWALHDKYERWPALNDVEAQLPDPTFYRAFVDVWSNSETNDRHLELIDRLIKKRTIQAERVMPHLDKEDREFFDSLPDEVTIYRGTTVENPYADYSWTTDADKALCFARRCYEATPALAAARVKKKDLLFAHVGRNESGVAIRTKAIRRKRLKSVGPYQTNDAYKIYAAVKAGALDLMDDGTNFVLGRAMSGRAMGMSVSQVRDYFYKDLEYLRFLGFASAPDRRELILERVDWQKLERRLARFHEEAEDWDVWDNA
jgi:hypothetical protein